MSEVMAETSEGDASNVSGGDIKPWLIPCKVLDHYSREVCDAWKARQHLEPHVRLIEESLHT